jgi:ribonucleoside-diphosphate reductase alpha chain
MTETESIQTVYKYETVLSESLKFFNGDDLAATTWINKYALTDPNGNYLEASPNDMHHRLAQAFYNADSQYGTLEDKSKLSDYGQIRKRLSKDIIYKLFKDFKYLIP